MGNNLLLKESPVAGCCEHDPESLDCINDGKNVFTSWVTTAELEICWSGTSSCDVDTLQVGVETSVTTMF
jgi:hypothetical protein